MSVPPATPVFIELRKVTGYHDFAASSVEADLFAATQDLLNVLPETSYSDLVRIIRLTSLLARNTPA